MRNKTLQYRMNVGFTDEATTEISRSDGCVCVANASTNEWLLRCTIATVKNGAAHLMGWGCTNYDKVGPITTVHRTVTGIKYRTILKERFLRLAVERLRNDKAATLQDSNAPVVRL